ncbi:MAG: hypothetical protein ABI886_11770 [Betaproteobacteria bacterium]
MKRLVARAPRSRQRGWIGLIVMLLALVVVALLAKDALKEYGMQGGAGAPAGARTQRDRMPTPGAVPGDVDIAGALPSAGTPLERARGVEGMLQEQVTERARRAEEATK